MTSVYRWSFLVLVKGILRSLCSLRDGRRNAPRLSEPPTYCLAERGTSERHERSEYYESDLVVEQLIRNLCNKKALRVKCFGAGEGNRTPDLLIPNQLLYRLSHTSLVTCLQSISKFYVKVKDYSYFFKTIFYPRTSQKVNPTWCFQVGFLVVVV